MTSDNESRKESWQHDAAMINGLADAAILAVDEDNTQSTVEILTAIKEKASGLALSLDDAPRFDEKLAGATR